MGENVKRVPTRSVAAAARNGPLRRQGSVLSRTGPVAMKGSVLVLSVIFLEDNDSRRFDLVQ